VTNPQAALRPAIFWDAHGFPLRSPEQLLVVGHRLRHAVASIANAPGGAAAIPCHLFLEGRAMSDLLARHKDGMGHEGLERLVRQMSGSLTVGALSRQAKNTISACSCSFL
jgi:hypothetical protein